MWPVLLLLTASPTSGLFSPSDTRTIQTLVSKNLTEGFGHFAEDILQTSYVGKIFTSEFNVFEIGDHEIDELMGYLVRSVEEKFEKARAAILNVKNSLVAYYSQPRAPRSGPPRIVPSCCKSPPGSQYTSKLRLEVDPLHQCYARDLATSGQGFDLWADEALDLMKVNFETVPSILWQEVGTNNGLHVQFPNRNRSCDVRGFSNSPLLSKAYRTRMTQRPLNLVLVLDASQEMLQPVHGSSPPVNHFQIVKKAAIDVLGTLTSQDKVTVVTTGRSVTVASSCNSSLMVNTKDKLGALTDFIQKTTANGSADYIGAFRMGFQLLTAQEKLDEASSQDSTNVFLFLTNAESPLVLREKLFFQEVTSGQSQLKSPALMYVYTLQMLGHQAAFETFHKLADQNNQKLAANDSTSVVTAGSWSQFDILEPVGPVGYIISVSDKVKFAFSDHVVQFAEKIPTTAPTSDFVLDHVQYDSKEGLTIRSVTPLSSEGAANVYGLLATNLSVADLLSSLNAFRHQLHSYAYVVERGTGHVIVHPKLVAKTEKTSRTVTLTSLDAVEPDLTSDHVRRIMTSDPTGSHFEAKIRPGREIFRAGREADVTAQTARIDHRLVRDTNFIVVLVIFNTELTQRVPAQHEVDVGPTSGVENRFDKLSSDQQMCASSDVLALESKLGIKFSPDLFVDPQAYTYKDLTVTEREQLDTFIKYPTQGPAVLQSAIGNANMLADLTAVTSGELMTVWNNSATTALHRFIGTTSGMVSLLPAVILANKMDTRSYQWYTQALASPQAVVMTTETFPGRSARTIISKAVVDGQQTLGVAGASIPPQALRSHVISKVPLCNQGSYMCELVSSEGYLFDVLSASPPPPTGRRHLTKAYPWLANKLVQMNVMQVTWCLEASNHRNRLGYFITAPPSGVNNLAGPNDCKKFALHKVGRSNVFLLVFAKRLPGQCPPDIETCASSPPVPPQPGRPLSTVPLCSACAHGVSVVPKCQNLCYCPMTTEACPSIDLKPRSGMAFVACQDEPGDLDPHEVTPPPPHPGVPKCAAKCSEKTSQSECQQLPGCVWDLNRVLPTCVRLTPLTTSTSAQLPHTPPKLTEASTSRAINGPQLEGNRE